MGVWWSRYFGWSDQPRLTGTRGAGTRRKPRSVQFKAQATMAALRILLPVAQLNRAAGSSLDSPSRQGRLFCHYAAALHHANPQLSECEKRIAASRALRVFD